MTLGVRAGGVGPLGGLGLGSGDVDDIVRDLGAVAGPLGTAMVTHAVEDPHDGEGHRLVLYVDGKPASVLGPAEAAGIGPLADGNVAVELVAVRRGAEVLPQWIGGLSKIGKARLRWTRASETDVVAYKVYWDGGLGGGALAEALATVDTVTVEELVNALPTSGSGTGRISIGGSYQGDVVNGTLTVTVDAGAATATVAFGGSTIATLTIGAGEDNVLSNGLRVIWTSSSGYLASDVWSVKVGVANEWTSDELEDGTYEFQIAAVDAAGNEGTASSAASVVIAQAPAPVSALAGTYDETTGEVTLTWTGSGDSGVTVQIYTDWSTQTDAVGSHIIAENPIATAAMGDETDTIALGVTGDIGDVRFLARAKRDSDGVEEESLLILTVDCRATLVDSDVSAPYAVTAVPAAGGKITVGWQFDERERAAASFEVFVGVTLPSTATASVASGGSAWETGTWTSTGTYGVAQLVAVRAVFDDGSVSEMSDTVSVTPDASAPAQVTGVIV